MTKKTIRYIILLMSFALVGLIGFQIYWVNNALKINEARFTQDVHEALNKVVNKLEMQETLLIAEKNFKSKFRWSDPLDLDADSIELFESSFQKRVVNRDELENDSVSLPEHTVLSYQFEANDGIEIIADLDDQGNLENADETVDNSGNVKMFRKEYKNNSEISQNIRTDFQKISRKAEMFNLVLNEIISGKRQIKNRIDIEQLDRLLASEFKNRGIDLSYDFGVISEGNEEFVISRIDDDHFSLRSTELSAALFPYDVISPTSTLLVNFPDKSTFLIRKLALTLASSAIMILIIIFCFIYAMVVIIKQKKLSEIKNDFINNMTHEFKTPIATVSLACEALQEDELKNNPDIQKRYIGIINEENKRLGRQVEKVLQMAALDKSEFDLKITELNIHSIIEDAIGNINMQIEKKGGKVNKSLNAVDPVLAADELHISNIIRNLLDNANKYSPAHPQITIETINTRSGIHIRIADQGIGIAKEALNKIFDKFYRVPTGNLHDFKGFGLGLAYVKTMVEAHGGSIAVKSELNKGSEFELYFPKENAKSENIIS